MMMAGKVPSMSDLKEAMLLKKQWVSNRRITVKLVYPCPDGGIGRRATLRG